MSERFQAERCLWQKDIFRSGKNDIFTDAWEQRKILDFIDKVSFLSSEKQLPRVEYEDIVSDSGFLNKNIFHKESEKTGLAFRTGDILFGKLRPYLHNWLLANFDGVAVGDFWIFRSKKSDSQFIFSFIQTNHYQSVANQSAGSKMPRSDWSLISTTDFLIPLKIDEQKKIGSLFASLDNLITLHQRKDFQSMRGLKYGKQLQKNRPFLEILCFLDSNL